MLLSSVTWLHSWPPWTERQSGLKRSLTWWLQRWKVCAYLMTYKTRRIVTYWLSRILPTCSKTSPDSSTYCLTLSKSRSMHSSTCLCSTRSHCWRMPTAVSLSSSWWTWTYASSYLMRELCRKVHMEMQCTSSPKGEWRWAYWGPKLIMSRSMWSLMLSYQ